MTTRSRYPIPAATYRVEEEIKRSRFITTIAYTPTVAAARSFIAAVSAEFADASHNCWAYVVGPPGSSGQIGLSDDGEPHGTAGRPMLTVLLHANLGDVTAVVTRYFGGTLLGKGGLVKAYSGGIELALRTLPVMEHVPKTELTLVIDYSAITLFQRLAPAYEAAILSEEYALDATYRLQMPTEHVDAFIAALTDLTHGGALIEVGG